MWLVSAFWLQLSWRNPAIQRYTCAGQKWPLNSCVPSSLCLQVIVARDGERLSTLPVSYEPQAVSFHPTQPEVAIGGKVHSNSDNQLNIMHMYTKAWKACHTKFLWFCVYMACSSVVSSVKLPKGMAAKISFVHSCPCPLAENVWWFDLNFLSWRHVQWMHIILC